MKSAIEILLKVVALLPALGRLIAAIAAATDEDTPGGKKVTPGEIVEIVSKESAAFLKSVVEAFRKSA